MRAKAEEKDPDRKVRAFLVNFGSSGLHQRQDEFHFWVTVRHSMRAAYTNCEAISLNVGWKAVWSAVTKLRAFSLAGVQHGDGRESECAGRSV